jgi:hypothetical protein
VRGRREELVVSKEKVLHVVVGGGSLLLSDHVGALEPVWAWLTLAWGLAVLVVARPLRGPA